MEVPRNRRPVTNRYVDGKVQGTRLVEEDPTVMERYMSSTSSGRPLENNPSLLMWSQIQVQANAFFEQPGLLRHR